MYLQVCLTSCSHNLPHGSNSKLLEFELFYSSTWDLTRKSNYPKVQLNYAIRDGNTCLLSRDWFSDKRHRLGWQTGRTGVVHGVELSAVRRLTKMLSSPGCVSILVLWWKVTGQDIREWHVTFLKEQPHHSGTFEPFAAAFTPGGASSTETDC